MFCSMKGMKSHVFALSSLTSHQNILIAVTDFAPSSLLMEWMNTTQLWDGKGVPLLWLFLQKNLTKVGMMNLIFPKKLFTVSVC